LISVALVFSSAFFSVPGNWDVLSYHLPRVLYYLQYGSFADFPTAYWAQISHPQLGPTWLIFVMMTVGFRENFFFLPQFLGWIVSALAIFGICGHFNDRLSPTGTRGFVRGWLVFILALFPLMEMLGASTERNDILVLAYSAAAFFFLFSEQRQAGIWGAVAMALALAVKATALPLVPIWIFFYFFRRPIKFSQIFIGLVIAFLIVADSGYGKNFLRFGNAFGPSGVMHQHSLRSFSEIVHQGGKNIFRYAIDSGTPDGWPGLNSAERLVSMWRESGIEAGKSLFGTDLGKGELYGEFSGGRSSLAHEDPVYYGLAYLLLALFAAVVFFIREKNRRELVLWFLPALLLYVIHSFTLRYDPWHGRFFMVNGIFLVPLLARGLDLAWQKRTLKNCCLALLFLLFVQNIYSIILRNNQRLFQKGARLELALRNRPEFLPIFQKLERTVPEQAVLAIRIPEDLPEYLLFGPRLNRIVISAFDFSLGPLKTPPNAGWLFFHSSLGEVEAGDEALGQGFFLRKL